MKTRNVDFADELRGDDPVSSPSHYQLRLPDGDPVEAIDYIQAVLGDDMFVAYCHGSALKYLSRAGRKMNFSEDLRKSAWFAIRAAQVVEEHSHPDEFSRNGVTF